MINYIISLYWVGVVLALSLIIASLLRYIAMYKQHEISPMYILLIVSGSIGGIK